MSAPSPSRSQLTPAALLGAAAVAPVVALAVAPAVALAVALVALGILAGCDGGPDPHAYQWDLPPGFPTPVVPEDNPMSEEKVELGRRLFYDTRLSGNQTQSCASCHLQSLAFTDGAAVATGSTSEMTPRSSMSLANVAYNSTQTWANPVVETLEQQALIPMFGEVPVELGLAGMEQVMLDRLAEDPDYPELFLAAFPQDPEPISLGNVVKAIASFERTLISGDAPLDRYLYQGDDSAVSEEVLMALELFNTERFECFHCHGTFNYTDSIRHTRLDPGQASFHNTALYNIDGRGSYPEPNRGLLEVSGMRADMGRFRAPTLRNIALTAPYMHDGSIPDLDGVLDHYAAGGRTIPEGPYAGVGSENPLKSIFMVGFEMSAEERAAFMAFFEALTDETFTNDPRFSDPFSE